MTKGEFSYLDNYAHVMGNSDYDALDREDVIDILDATVKRPRMRNICLIAEPGMGKTQVVDTWAKQSKHWLTTYEIDVESLGGIDSNRFGERIKGLVAEIESINLNDEKSVAMFIDEVHVLGRPEYSIALEALKPAMTNGKIIFIGATTDEEYIQYIESNAALTDRFEKLNLPEVSRETIMTILKSMWDKELPKTEPINEELLNTIIDYGRYKPSQSQPRKAIKMLDDLIGWYRSKDVILNESLLDRRIMSTTGVNPKFQIDIDHMEKTMKKRVKGQEFAIDTLINSLHISVAGLNDPTRPMGSFIFLGPTGVGKTEIAKSMAEGLFGHEDMYIRFDMSEFQHVDDVQKFNLNIADKVFKKPFSVILLDEVEKAHRGVMDLLLQILDDGRLSNRYGRQVTFRNAYIIMTTNIGHKDFENARTTNQSMTEKLDTANDILQRPDAFRPELVNRTNAIVPFEHLSREVRNIIAETRINELQNELQKRNITFDYDPDVITFITREVSDEATTSGGGRDINRKIADYLRVLVAKLLNKYSKNGKDQIVDIYISVFGEKLVGNKLTKHTRASLGFKKFKVKNRDGTLDVYEGNVEEGIKATDQKASHYVEKLGPSTDEYEYIFSDNIVH